MTLAQRLRKATGPSRILDAEIEVSAFKGRDGSWAKVSMIHGDCAPGTYWIVSRSGISLRTSEPRTASVDAALGLVATKDDLGMWSRLIIERKPTHDKDWWLVTYRDHAKKGVYVDHFYGLALAICAAWAERMNL